MVETRKRRARGEHGGEEEGGRARGSGTGSGSVSPQVRPRTPSRSPPRRRDAVGASGGAIVGSPIRETRRQIFKMERVALNGLLASAASDGECSPPQAPRSPVRFVHVPGDESTNRGMHGMAGPQSTLFELRVTGVSSERASPNRINVGLDAGIPATEQCEAQGDQNDTVFFAAFQAQPD